MIPLRGPSRSVFSGLPEGCKGVFVLVNLEILLFQNFSGELLKTLNEVMWCHYDYSNT